MTHDENDDQAPVAEGEARRLLAAAAATVHVEPHAPLTLTGLPEPLPAPSGHGGGRRWLAVIAAAAAVVGLVGGGVVVGMLAGADRERPPTDRPTTATTLSSESATPTVTSGLPLKLEHAATAFRSWADGSFPFPPSFAARVRLLLQDAPWDTLTFEQAQDPLRWSMCSGVAPADCRLNPVAAVRDAGELEWSRQPGSVCRALEASLPADLEAARADDLVRLSPVDVGCDTIWHVELWVDDEEEIYAVNFVTGIP